MKRLRRLRLRPLATIAALLLATGCIPAMRSGSGGGPPPRRPGVPPPKASPDRTRVVLWAGEPIAEGRNTLWSAGGQLAWDALADRLGTGGRLALGEPAPAAVVAGLNQSRFPLADLDSASFVVEAGPAQEALGRFKSGLRRMGVERFPMPLPDLLPDDVAALAYIRKELPFRHRFHVHAKPLAFAGGPARVVAFGIDPADRGLEVGPMRAQARLHAPEGAATADRVGARLALELVPEDERDRIVLAAMPAPRTLDDGWRQAASWLALPEAALADDVSLAIPKMDFAADRVFDELVSTRIGRPPTSWFLKDARQRIEFTLSETGARFVSATSMTVGCASAPRIRSIAFDRPFLLALVRTGASRPYFLAWFSNDDLFVKG